MLFLLLLPLIACCNGNMWNINFHNNVNNCQQPQQPTHRCEELVKLAAFHYSILSDLTIDPATWADTHVALDAPELVWFTETFRNDSVSARQHVIASIMASRGTQVTSEIDDVYCNAENDRTLVVTGYQSGLKIFFDRDDIIGTGVFLCGDPANPARYEKNPFALTMKLDKNDKVVLWRNLIDAHRVTCTEADGELHGVDLLG
eukprot:TRINITY_DN76457_c0_g1_i1.p1 TRINITY_DN76457_c0_g1~~TRINITY_DN76457_c0_g1_i1.p1  ORF type:complete len:203 (+),score=20.88 TRINITY_DN76457_c0_g1_i1:89-697(+)